MWYKNYPHQTLRHSSNSHQSYFNATAMISSKYYTTFVTPVTSGTVLFLIGQVCNDLRNSVTMQHYGKPITGITTELSE